MEGGRGEGGGKQNNIHTYRMRNIKKDRDKWEVNKKCEHHHTHAPSLAFYLAACNDTAMRNAALLCPMPSLSWASSIHHTFTGPPSSSCLYAVFVVC